VAEGRHAGSDAGERLADDGSRSAEAGQGAAWPVLGGLLFVWGTLGLINVWAITPDLLVAVFVFAAFRYLLRIRRGQGGVRAFLGLGLALGIGYWAKAAMFVLAPTFLLAAWLLASPGVRTRRTLLAGGAFLVLALPLLGSLTIAKGRVTFGDSGRLNVWWYGNGRPQILWREPAAVHPPRVLLSEPLTYAYDDGPGGTYPLWFDPSYWQDGSSPTLDATAIGRAVAANGWHLWGLLRSRHAPSRRRGSRQPVGACHRR
jgi:4-amino-4-deoxy-L-arabinose transferase-like glycosyltransferase